MMPPAEDPIAEAILRLTAACGAAKSISPSDVAHDLAGGEETAWQPLLGPIRRTALALAEAGRIEILRKGKPVPAAEVRGVIRLRQRG